MEINRTNNQQHLMVMYREFYIIHKYNESMELLKKELGPKAETVISLLAEPAIGSTRDHEIFWHTKAKGKPRPFSSLSAAEREEAVEEVKLAAKEVAELAARLISSGDPNKAVQGEILKLIFTWPDNESSVFKVGGQTVLTNWGLKVCPPSIPHKGAPAQIKTSRFFSDKSEKSEEKIHGSSAQGSTADPSASKSRRPVWIFLIIAIVAVLAVVGFTQLRNYTKAAEPSGFDISVTEQSPPSPSAE